MSEAALRGSLERAQAFRALARAFAPPRELARMGDDLAAFAARATGALGASLAQAHEALRGDAGVLEAAYDALFSGRGGVPARESAYADGRSIAPTELADLRGFLLAFGLEERGELVDHVASECELASLLALKEGWALAEGESERAEIARQAYEALVRDHLAPFVPRFAARVRGADAPRFYDLAADALEAFVAGEAERLGAPPCAPGDAGCPAPGDPDGDFACGGCRG